MKSRIHVLVAGEVAIPPQAVFNNCGSRYPEGISVQGTEVVAWADGTRSEAVRQPVLCFLIDTGKEKILVDTGIGNFAAIRAYRHARGDRFFLRETERGSIEDQLNAIGIDADDISVVAYTHLHWDHVGEGARFRKARHIAHRAEWDLALICPRYAPHYYPVALRSVAGLKDRMELLDGDAALSDTVRLVRVGGHTPGSMIVLVETDAGRVILCGDAVPRYENWRYRWVGPAGNIWNLQELVDAYGEIERIGGTVVPSHDWNVLATYPSGVIGET